MVENNKISGKAPNRYDIMIEFIEWLANRHYQDGLSKDMIIKKAKETLEKVNSI